MEGLGGPILGAETDSWNIYVTTVVGKEPELVKETERYKLDTVGFTSTHCLGSRTSRLHWVWTLSDGGVAPAERWSTQSTCADRESTVPLGDFNADQFLLLLHMV